MTDDDVLTQVIGYTAATTLTITLMPQLILTFRTKNVENLSICFLLLQQLTCVLFLVYGLLLKEAPLIVANSITVTQGAALLTMKYIYNYKNKVYPISTED